MIHMSLPPAHCSQPELIRLVREDMRIEETI